MKKIFVINGPNLNLLGKREPLFYGRLTLKDVENQLKSIALKELCDIEFFQSNHEGAIIDYLNEIYMTHQHDITSFQKSNKSDGSKESTEKSDKPNIGVGIIINPGAYTHKSIGIRDAIVIFSTAVPFVEVHITNLYKREEFRKHSYLSDIASGIIVGCGIKGYSLALRYLLELN